MAWPKTKHRILSYFGYKYFIHNNEKGNLEKFDAKANEGIFLGYSTSSRAYRIFNKSSLVVEDSIHIVFDKSSSNKSKELEEEEEEANKNFENYNDNQDKQTKIDNKEENDKDEDIIDP